MMSTNMHVFSQKKKNIAMHQLLHYKGSYIVSGTNGQREMYPAGRD